ncbi:type II secretion system protein [Spirulina sp. CCNP1310]|uniref:pilus assembly FimT family protein n=1 Tax=Spirulina sp. CCNP1310 TaxID=3110249 RepID=UPI002B20CBD2|nr:type II secretion system protein [Spirulina sp. CCNP1310]MEA5417926.1 type II secretion system protein [Spirulina sp. CCNP1310]
MAVFRGARGQAGFTLVEMLIVIVLIGILGSIAVVTWQGFFERQRLVQSSDRLFLTLQSTRETAKHRHLPWQVSIRQGANRVEFAAHPADPDHTTLIALWDDPQQWEQLAPGVSIDRVNDHNQTETTITSKTIAEETVWFFLFNHQGCPVQHSYNSCTDTLERGRLGLRIERGGNGPQVLRRCVILSTALGSMRQGRGHTRLDREDNKYYCY